MQQTPNYKTLKVTNSPICSKRPKIKKTPKFRKNDKNSKKFKKKFKILGVSMCVYYFRVRVGEDSFIVVIFFLKVCHVNVVFNNCCRQEKIFLEFPNRSEDIYFHSS